MNIETDLVWFGHNQGVASALDAFPCPSRCCGGRSLDEQSNHNGLVSAIWCDERSLNV